MIRNKRLVSIVADKTYMTKVDVAKVLGAITETITEELMKGESVRLYGFGRFETFLSTARRCVDPTDYSKTMERPDVVTPKFRASSILKKLIKEAHVNNNDKQDSHPESKPDPIETVKEELDFS